MAWSVHSGVSLKNTSVKWISHQPILIYRLCKMDDVAAKHRENDELCCEDWLGISGYQIP